MFATIKFLMILDVLKISLLLNYNLDSEEVCCDFECLNYFIFKEIFYSFFSLMK